MHLEAIELDQVGIFTSPVRISGISSGLNVLVGANELGKSTILRGLMTLFTEQHRTAKQSVRSLRPYGGGAPFVACDYRYGGHSWRLEKRYLSAHAALLERRDGAERHQGADAENRLLEQLGRDTGFVSVLPLLWVEQGARSFEVPVLDESARLSMGQLLTAQAENTSGVGAAQGVLKAVEAELRQLVTDKTGRARKNSTYDQLLVEQEQVRAALAEARRKASDAEQRVARLTELEQASSELQDPRVHAGLVAQISELEQRLRSAEEARLRLQQINERVAFLESQLTQRESTLAAHDAGLDELASLGEVLKSADEELTEIGAKAATVSQNLRAVEVELANITDQEAALHIRAEQHRRAEEQENRRQRLELLTRQHERFRAITKDLDAIGGELGQLTWPDETLAKLRRARSRVDQALARRQASTPRVRIAYEAGRQRGFQIAGHDLRDGDEVAIDAPVAIEVEGIGRIEVVPNDTAAMTSVTEDLQGAEAEFDGCLALMGASNADDAEARQDRRNVLLRERQVLLAERRSLAPDGEAKLRSELSELRSQVEDADQATPVPTSGDDGSSRLADTGNKVRGSQENVVSTLEAVQSAHALCQSQVEHLRNEKAALDQRRAEIAAELRVRRTRHDELRLKYADKQNGGNKREELVALVELAEKQLNDAVRDRLAVQEVVLTETVTLELKQGLGELRTRLQSRSDHLAGVLQEIRHLEGMLTRDFEDGAGEQVGELAGRAEELGLRVREIKEQISALRLLAEHLRFETTQRRDAIAKPLAVRLSALASRVWPGVDVPLNSDLSVDGLVRQGRQEHTDQVSIGTREQIAVMARLAYADLLTENLEPLPVIFDDPLVYTDDYRLEALFETMAEAAKVHQIIVLTCHERAFEPLVTQFGATSLAVESYSAVAST